MFPFKAINLWPVENILPSHTVNWPATSTHLVIHLGSHSITSMVAALPSVLFQLKSVLVSKLNSCELALTF